MKEIAIGINVSVKVESVVCPTVIYNDTEKTGVYFKTRDERFGRITFEQLDSLRVSRGEYLPYKDNFDWKNPNYCWISKVENSKWLTERYKYELKHYGKDYNWGGNVDEMLTDFSHYIFQFHDQFVEVIAKGFWIEVDDKKLINKKLLSEHPFLPNLDNNPKEIHIQNRIYKAHANAQSLEKLISQSEFCTQKLLTIFSEEGKHPEFSLTLFKGKYYLLDYFGRTLGTFDKIITLEQIKSLIETEK